MRTHATQRGFTLIELMIVLAIIGILLAIAIPNYSDYVTSSKLTEGTSQLSTMRTKIEQFYQDNRDYTGACAAGTGVVPTSELFTFDCANMTATTYTARATGQANRGLDGFVFTLNQAGTKTTTATQSGWNSGASCWITQRRGSC